MDLQLKHKLWDLIRPFHSPLTRALRQRLGRNYQDHPEMEPLNCRAMVGCSGNRSICHGARNVGGEPIASDSVRAGCGAAPLAPIDDGFGHGIAGPVSLGKPVIIHSAHWQDQARIELARQAAIENKNIPPPPQIWKRPALWRIIWMKTIFSIRCLNNWPRARFTIACVSMN